MVHREYAKIPEQFTRLETTHAPLSKMVSNGPSVMQSLISDTDYSLSGENADDYGFATDSVQRVQQQRGELV